MAAESGQLAVTPRRYTSPDEDSARWLRFAHRSDDIVISSRSKHGTTWLQMICALLVFQSTELPAPLAQISPWLDWLVEPFEQLALALDAQEHRRIIKTHTPLDGLPLRDRVTYLVIAREPLDAAVSLHHQSANIDRERLRRLTGTDGASEPPISSTDLRGWLDHWVGARPDPSRNLDSLPGVILHLRDAWHRREAGNVVLLRYSDLQQDLEGQMRRLAARLGIEVAENRWPELVEAARFSAMRRRAAQLAPDPHGVLRDPSAFFREGREGAGLRVADARLLRAYEQSLRSLAAPDLRDWLSRCAERPTT